MAEYCYGRTKIHYRDRKLAGTVHFYCCRRIIATAGVAMAGLYCIPRNLKYNFRNFFIFFYSIMTSSKPITVYIGFYEPCFLRTSQITNQIFRSLQKSYLSNANKNGFYELRFLRTSQFTNHILGPLKCLFMLNTSDFTNFFSKNFNRMTSFFLKIQEV